MEDGERTKAPQRSQRGISLLIAVMAIAIMLSTISDMILTSAVQVELASGTRDRIKAEYLAKSGANLAVLLLSVSFGIDLFRSGPNAPAPFKQDRVDDASSIWNSFNSLPPLGAMTVALAQAASKAEDDPFGLKGLMSEGVANVMALFEDEFSIQISDEQGKINLNDCRQGRCPETTNMLDALFSCPIEKAFLESKHLSPEELRTRIKDFIQAKATDPTFSTGDVKDPYQKETPPYLPKGLPLDSVEELRLVDGWDDEIHAVFSPYLTTFLYNEKRDFSKVNINTAPKELMACLMPEAQSGGCHEKFALGWEKIQKDKSPIAASTNQIKEKLKNLFCYLEDEQDKQSANNKETWFDVKSDFFRVKVNARTGSQDLNLDMVIRRIPPKSNAFLRNKQRTKRSYQIVTWKMR